MKTAVEVPTPVRPLLLFAPGAGAPSSHPWMRRWSELLSDIGHVQTFDYSYMRERRGRPDPLPKLVEAHREALRHAKLAYEAPSILVGKSMGGRIGCHVALAEKVAGLVCFGYPLCGGGDTAKLRDKVLRELSTPILFIQGTRDALCPLDLLWKVRSEMTVANELYVVEGGDHSLAVTKTQLKTTGQTQADVDGSILREIRRFIDAVAPKSAAAS